MHKPSPNVKILAGRLFDSYAGDVVANRLITVSPTSGLIVGVEEFKDSKEWFAEAGIDLGDESTIDLRGLTVLPGFIDTHVHFFLHPYSETSWTDQVTRESLAERTVRATVHARRTLMAGYTTVRDLGTEGALDADLALRKCLSGPNPIAVGPRYFIANRAIVATGSYGPKNILYPDRDGVEGIMGAEVADGEVGCSKAIRRQIGAGTDWIKIYDDYRIRANLSDVAPKTAATSFTTFTSSEVESMVSEAHRLGVKIAAHASESATLLNLTRDGRTHIDSIEHGHDMLSVIEAAKDRGTVFAVGADAPDVKPLTWVPTLAVYWTQDRHGERWDRAVKSFQAFLNTRPAGLRIATGGDTAVFPHGDNALEMTIMVRLGAPWREVLQWATLGGWECIRSMRWEGKEGEERLRDIEQLKEEPKVVGDNEVAFGALRKGFVADIIATTGDFTKDFEDAVDKSSISFVMKGGKVYKQDGKEVCTA